MTMCWVFKTSMLLSVQLHVKDVQGGIPRCSLVIWQPVDWFYILTFLKILILMVGYHTFACIPYLDWLHIGAASRIWNPYRQLSFKLTRLGHGHGSSRLGSSRLGWDHDWTCLLGQFGQSESKLEKLLVSPHLCTHPKKKDVLLR